MGRRCEYQSFPLLYILLARSIILNDGWKQVNTQLDMYMHVHVHINTCVYMQRRYV